MPASATPARPSPPGPERVVVAALARTNRVIGRGLELPWHLPADLRHFKRLTDGGILLMGRRTFESLLHQMGGPLPGRRHVVVTRNPAWTHPAAEVHPSIEAAWDALSGEVRVFVAGGAEIYAQTLADADRWELTFVEGTYEGDAVFPPFEHLVGTGRPFDEVRCDAHPTEAGRPAYAFATYRRRATPRRAPDDIQTPPAQSSTGGVRIT